ncbi:hypothetical protein CRYUN_Cryun05aG0142400 [Craigia yunnanensis]
MVDLALECRRSFSIFKENFPSAATKYVYARDALEANLRDKKLLVKLELEWDGHTIQNVEGKHLTSCSLVQT